MNGNTPTIRCRLKPNSSADNPAAGCKSDDPECSGHRQPAWRGRREGALSLLIACDLANGPTLAYERLMRLMRESFETDRATQLDKERDEFTASTKTADFKEALTAFFGKRPAVFKG